MIPIVLSPHTLAALALAALLAGPALSQEATDDAMEGTDQSGMAAEDMAMGAMAAVPPTMPPRCLLPCAGIVRTYPAVRVRRTGSPVVRPRRPESRA